MMNKYEVETLEKALRDIVDYLERLGIRKLRTYQTDWYWSLNRILERYKNRKLRKKERRHETK